MFLPGAPLPRRAGPPNWPEEYQPENAAFFVHNEITIKAPAEVVWDILIQVEAWPDWYEGAENLAIQAPAKGRLASDAVFTWKTMGLNFESRVAEFKPPRRLAWESRKRVIRGFHAWLIVPTDDGCRVITDESFQGFLAYLQGTFIPNKLHRLHDVFLVELKKLAEARVGDEVMQQNRPWNGASRFSPAPSPGRLWLWWRAAQSQSRFLIARPLRPPRFNLEKRSWCL